eukprot:TRINITY_DN1534_c0_g1_i1.p1 TRINITY_DN1534_c0_g1~~TRINITY_DN1534_c0_g1_i1.p1  ORF type:complete len:422 (+),score=94.74 TRINITY_DN1534_c0_g1_i1:526-1791(+)
MISFASTKLFSGIRKSAFSIIGDVANLGYMEGLRGACTNSIHSDPRHAHTSTVLGKRVYIFGGEVGGRLSNDIQIFDTSSEKWITPKVLGMKPLPRKGHSAVPLANDRILILGGTSEPKDNIWFLEVGTPYVQQQKDVQGKEVVAWSKGVIGEAPQPIVITGPSGVGKGTLISNLIKEFPSSFGFSVSHTTRRPRENELPGVHYHFTEREVMEREIQEGKFLESAVVHGNLYGTSIAAVEAVADAGKRCILDIDVQGAKSVRNSTLDALFIFVCPPSFEELEKRLRGRGTEQEDQIQRRLANAKLEIELAQTSSLFDYILVNDNLDSCYSKLKEILGLRNGSFACPVSDGVQSSLVEFVPLPGHTATLKNRKVTVHGGVDPEGRASKYIYLLDLTSIRGGAPARTQGLKLSIMEGGQLQID